MRRVTLALIFIILAIATILAGYTYYMAFRAPPGTDISLMDFLIKLMSKIITLLLDIK